MTEKELVRDILFSFKLTRMCLLNLKKYEVDLICDTYEKFKRDFIYDLLSRARKNYDCLSDEEIDKKHYNSLIQYEAEQKHKNRITNTYYML